jgi:hypothetical protein
MSALPPNADLVQHHRDVRFVPQADITAHWQLGDSVRDHASLLPLIPHERGLR